jgi:signal transduction histidine kinase
MQEALSIVARHSQASNVSVPLIKSDHRLEFFIKDNGIGFDSVEWRQWSRKIRGEAWDF